MTQRSQAGARGSRPPGVPSPRLEGARATLTPHPLPTLCRQCAEGVAHRQHAVVLLRTDGTLRTWRIPEIPRGGGKGR